MAEFSPMMKQYLEMKEQYKDFILLYRLGDFYEMFFDDAILASRELDIVLTGRDCGQGEKAPMCGVPFHSIDNYIARLVSKGYKVSVCEQVKDKDTNEVTKREVVRMITPGTVTEPSMLDESKNNYIVGAFSKNKKTCLCFIDISTGEILLNDDYKNDEMKILNDLSKYNPKEIYLNTQASKTKGIKDFIKSSNGCVLTSAIESENYIKIIEEHMQLTLAQLNINPDSLGAVTFGSLLKYIYDTQLCDLSHIKNLSMQNENVFMEIDYSTWRNLEIVESLRSKEKKGSLLGILDKTQTPMGARLMRRFLEKPSLSITEITKRQGVVKDFFDKTIKRTEIRQALSQIKDIERLSTKVVYATVNPREINALATSFSVLPKIKSIIANSDFKSLYVAEISKQLDDLSDLYEYINSAIKEESPISIREGNIIKQGFDDKVDDYRNVLTNAKQILADLEFREKERTGIKNLKTGYNKVFGYYIEISNSNKDSAPDDYIRKQTLVNCERFITEELKEIESKLMNADQNLNDREYELFCEVRGVVFKNIERIRKTSELISILDVLTSFSEVAVKNNYICPYIDDKNILKIENGRHPVVEQMLKDTMFIPNDTYLDTTANRMAIITGPNMAGKSTYMRGVALIVLMAQIGSFVPATGAIVGVIDKIFTRIGASDDLASGQSTFMVEMSEVANILKNATKKSLLVFDEIGRGTSTFDGMSIARAVLEYVAQKITAKSMFATHYHELIALEKTVNGVKNFNVAAKKRDNEIIFLRKIIEGGTDDSYGIDVARLAGVPDEVVTRAECILKTLESEHKVQMPIVIKKDEELQYSLGSSLGEEIIEQLKHTDLNVITPIEAMTTLYELSKKAKEF